MAIERQYMRGDGLRFIPSCDLCGESLPDEASFEDARSAMKEARWKLRKDELNDWQNVCADCFALEKGN
jgi:hypothetical protein